MTSMPRTALMIKDKLNSLLPQQNWNWTLRGATVLIIAAAAVLLSFMGQPLWCKCGSWIPWSWDIWSSHNSQHLFDPYTPSHVLHGVILCGVLYWLPRSVPGSARFMAAIVIEVGWEILENSPWIIERYRATTIALDYVGDSVANSISDILACAVGYGIAYRLRAIKSLIFSLVTELIVLIWIRDGLFLNVLMLLWPLESIKQWQMGIQ